MFCSSTSLVLSTISGGIGIGHVPADEDATPGLPLEFDHFFPSEFSESKRVVLNGSILSGNKHEVH
jgi:hypothetical protein